MLKSSGQSAFPPADFDLLNNEFSQSTSYNFETDQDDLEGFLLRSDGRRGEVLQLPQVQDHAPLVADASHQLGVHANF